MHLKNLFHIIENIIPDHFCNDIIKTGESKLFENGKLSGGDIKNRSSKVSWINDKKFQTPLSQFVQSANIESNWNFSLKEFEDLQYTIYNVDGHYDWHVDNHSKPYNNGMIRKLSFSICLNDEFEGGDFDLGRPSPLTGKTNIETFKLKKGEMIVFPSHTWHKVNKVTKGIRKTLVGWVVGSQWK